MQDGRREMSVGDAMQTSEMRAAGPVRGAPMSRPPRFDESGGRQRTFCTQSATYGCAGLKRVR